MSPQPSVFLYCHVLIGLGHLIRSLRIATALKAQAPAADIRVITGSRALGKVAWPDGVGLVELPPLPAEGLKSPDSAAIFGRRSRMVRDFLEETRPDALLVDWRPDGLRGELYPALRASEERKWPTQLVLGVPYVDLADWRPVGTSPKIRSALTYYDAALAYTDPASDPLLDRLPPADLPATNFYAGYVTESVQPRQARSAGPPLVVVLNGGGGCTTIFDLVEAILIPLVAAGRIRLRIIVGALNDAAPDPRMALWPEVELVPAMATSQAVEGADVIVSRCGYGTSYALLTLAQPIIFVPEYETGEQPDRARALGRLDGVWAVDNDAGQLLAALEQALLHRPGPRAIPFALDGASAAARWLLEVIVPKARRPG